MPAPETEQVLLHHFDDLEQQHQSSLLGMWAFLGTEVMFFGGLITAYIIYRISYFDAFVLASRHLNVMLGCINTVVLLGSSLTMALAVRASQLGQFRALVAYLVATMVLGAGFLGIKAYEYHGDYKDHLVPGLDFDWSLAERGHHPPGLLKVTVSVGRGGEAQSARHTSAEAPDPEPTLIPESRQAEMFFVLYFFMTGLHAIHLVIGIVLVGIMAILAGRRWFSGSGQTQIEVTGLYWHFIDIVWIFLYPLLYLIEVRT